jgi:S1-C subfamily serine protease
MMSARSFVLAALTAASAWPAVAGAQERRPEARPRVYISGDSDLVRNKIRMVTQRRARLGVTVDLQASTNDSIGATIESVTPGGPAAKAGIKSGDIITRLDGKSLVTTDAKRANEDQSLPGLRLVEIAAQLKPKDTVTVDYRREGTRHTTTLVTGDEVISTFDYPDWIGREPGWDAAATKMEMERMLPRTGRGSFEFGPGAGQFAFAFGPMMDLQLAPLNADLGQYFGTTEGVLVIDVPKESSLGVKGGDVILSIDGRKVDGPGSFMRKLRGYDPGETFKLEIMRNKARTTVTGKLEKHKEE